MPPTQETVAFFAAAPTDSGRQSYTFRNQGFALGVLTTELRVNPDLDNGWFSKFTEDF